MRKATKFASAVGAAALVGSSLGVHAFAAGTQHQAAGKPRLDRVFVIMLENHSKSSVIGNANAPYINKLATNNVIADHYYGVTHPSMPNYIAAIAGDNFGLQDDNVDNVVNLHQRNLVDQLESHHVRWGAYMEDLPADKLADNGPVYGTDANGKPKVQPLYAKKHNPFVLFDDVKNNPARMAKVKDYSSLAGDLAKKNAPQFVWITPNQCNDMHGGVYDQIPGHPETPCGYGSTKDDPSDAALKQKADAFVKKTVRTIRGSAAWTRHSAIVIVTDENDYTGATGNGGWESTEGCCSSPYVAKGDPRIVKYGETPSTWPGGTYGGGLVPAIIVSPAGPHGFVDHTPYNHYSLLRTIEDNWHMARLRHANDTSLGVRSMWPSFIG